MHVCACYKGVYTLYQKFFGGLSEKERVGDRSVRVQLFYCKRDHIKNQIDQQIFDFLEIVEYPCTAEEIGNALRARMGKSFKMEISVRIIVHDSKHFGLREKVESSKILV